LQLRIACFPYVARKAPLSAFFSAAHCFAARFFACCSLVGLPALASDALTKATLNAALAMITILLNVYLLLACLPGIS